MAKKVFIATHSDFDGAVAAYLIDKMVEVFNKEKVELEVNYCEFYNLEEVLDKYLSRIEGQEELQETFLIITDLVDKRIADRAERINSLYEKGLNVLYVDHRVFELSKAMDEKYDWVCYCEKRDKCASMQLFLLIIKSFIGDLKNLGEYLEFENLKVKAFLEEKLKELYGKEKYVIQADILKKLRGINEDKNAGKQFVGERLNLAWAANLVDYRRRNELLGLDELMRFWDISLEYEESQISETVAKMESILISKDKLERVSELAAQLMNKTKLEARVQESFKTTSFSRVFDKNGQSYNIGSCFGEGDIIFTVDDFRFEVDKAQKMQNQEGLEIDAFVSFSKISMSNTPVFTLRPVKAENAVELFEKVKKEHIRFGGSKIGVRGVYSMESYKKLTEIRKRIINIDRNEDKVVLRKEVDEIILNELSNIFYNVKPIQPTYCK